jgi:hypothetical protein
VLLWSDCFLLVSHCSLWKEDVYLGRCILEVCNLFCFLKLFIGAYSLEFALSVRGDFGLEMLDSVETLGTLGDGLNVFCIVKWT